MTWKEMLMSHVKPDAMGIEIGPGRVQPPPAGQNYDWIAAIRTLEYTPDLIGFFLGCQAALKEEGLLTLVLSDRRYSLDHFRPLTGLAAVIDVHEKKETTLSTGARIEAILTAVSKGGTVEWQAGSKGDYAALNPFAKAQEALASAQDDPLARRWCFTPISFLVLVSDLFQLGLTRFKIVGYQATGESGFYVTLGLGHGKLIDGPERLKAMHETSREQVVGDMPDFI